MIATIYVTLNLADRPAVRPDRPADPVALTMAFVGQVTDSGPGRPRARRRRRSGSGASALDRPGQPAGHAGLVVVLAVDPSRDPGAALLPGRPAHGERRRPRSRARSAPTSWAPTRSAATSWPGSIARDPARLRWSRSRSRASRSRSAPWLGAWPGYVGGWVDDAGDAGRGPDALVPGLHPRARDHGHAREPAPERDRGDRLRLHALLRAPDPRRGAPKIRTPSTPTPRGWSATRRGGWS